MSRESLFSLLDGMKNRMTCLETKAKQEETDIDTLKQNMDKIEKTTNEISTITEKLLSNKKDAENASAKKNVASGRLKTEPNKTRGAGVRGKSSKPLARNKTTANLKTTTTHASNKKSATTFNSKPKGNSAIKTSKSVSRLKTEENKSTPIKTDKGNNNKKAAAKTLSAKSTAKVGKDLGNDIDKADTKKKEDKKDNKKEITTIKEENAQEDNTNNQKKEEEKVSSKEETQQKEETTKQTEMSEHHKTAINYINTHKLFYKPTIDITNIDVSSLKTVLNDIVRNFKTHLDEIQNSITSLKQSNSENPEVLTEPIPEFALTKGSEKAIEMLNEDKYISLFQTQTETPSNEIIIVFRLYLQLTNKNKQLISMENNDSFWKEFSQHIINNSNNQIGNFVSNEVTSFDFSNENVLTLSKMVVGFEKVLTPSYYSTICPTTGLFMYIVKDVLEYTGILPDKQVSPARLNINLNYEYEKYKQMIEDVEQIQKNI